MSQGRIAEFLNQILGYQVSRTTVNSLKASATAFYQESFLLKSYISLAFGLLAGEGLWEHTRRGCLLLGDPATGKSTIAAILATMASEQADHPATSPMDQMDSWTHGIRTNLKAPFGWTMPSDPTRQEKTSLTNG
jgi:hypothetical protein